MPRPRPARSPPSRSSTATTRRSARRASACAAALTGPIRLLHGTYLQDWLLRAEDNNWRVDAELGGASRTFADIGSHWCDLAEFVSGHRITRAQRPHADRAAAAPARREPARRSAPRRTDGEVRDVGTEDAAVMQFETDQGALGTTIVSQISAGRKNRLWLEFDGAEEAIALRPGGRRRRCGSAAARPPRCCAATPSTCRPTPRGSPRSRPATRRATPTASTCSSTTSTREIRGEAPPDGVPTFGDGLRAAQIIEAVLASSQEERWVDVAAPVGAAS